MDILIFLFGIKVELLNPFVFFSFIPIVIQIDLFKRKGYHRRMFMNHVTPNIVYESRVKDITLNLSFYNFQTQNYD